MMTRCYNSASEFFKYYGGRGIVVCEEWHNVSIFIGWCELQPFENGMTLDRHPDNDGNYSPENCRFATPKQQNRNMRSNVWIEHNEERLIFKDFVIKYGVVSPSIAQRRRKKLGWDPKDAAFTPLNSRSERWSQK